MLCPLFLLGQPKPNKDIANKNRDSLTNARIKLRDSFNLIRTRHQDSVRSTVKDRRKREDGVFVYNMKTYQYDLDTNYYKGFSLGGWKWGIGFGSFRKYSGIKFAFSDKDSRNNGIGFNVWVNENSTGKTMNGFQFSVLSGLEKIHGISISALGSLNRKGWGIGLAGILAISDTFTGRSMASCYLQSEYYRGIGMSFFNYIKDVRGLEIGVYNESEYVHGIQLGLRNRGPQNFANGAYVHGAQLGAINTASEMHGLQAGLVNGSESSDGVQIGVINHGGSTDLSFQFGAINTIDYGSGAQIGLLNSGNLGGLQLGLFNICHENGTSSKTLQFGLVNISNELPGIQIGLINRAYNHGFQIGLININRRKRHFKVMPFLNWKRSWI